MIIRQMFYFDVFRSLPGLRNAITCSQESIIRGQVGHHICWSYFWYVILKLDTLACYGLLVVCNYSNNPNKAQLHGHFGFEETIAIIVRNSAYNYVHILGDWHLLFLCFLVLWYPALLKCNFPLHLSGRFRDFFVETLLTTNLHHIIHFPYITQNSFLAGLFCSIYDKNLRCYVFTW